MGDDWAEDHHNVELMDVTGQRLARARLPEGVAGIARLHVMIGEQLDEDMLADMVRTDSHQLRPVAGDTAQAQAVEVVTRAHKTLIWERTRHTQRLRYALRDSFPAALGAFEDLDAADTLGVAGQGTGMHSWSILNHRSRPPLPVTRLPTALPESYG